MSAGLAAESIAAQALQRLRWARGTLQAFSIEANPLTIQGLRPMQRLAHLEGILHWFTPKGTSRDRFQFNWRLAAPLMIFFIATAMSLWMNLGYAILMGAWQPMTDEVANQMKGVDLGWIWSAFNLLTLSIALLILIDVPRPHTYDEFDLHRTVKVQVGDQVRWGFTTGISEIGATIALTQQIAPKDSRIQVDFLEEDLTLLAQITQVEDRPSNREFPLLQIHFEPLSLEQERCLIQLLYCRPGQWRSRCAPGELRSLWLLFQVLLKPRVIFDRTARISTVSVNQISS